MSAKMIKRRWGYKDVNDTKEQVKKMREANIPLEGMSQCLYFPMKLLIKRVIVMWNDIDLYREYCYTVS